MKNRIKILQFLLENFGREFSIRTIARSVNLNYRLAFHDIKKLESEKLIVICRLGNNNLCSFSSNFQGDILTIEIMKRGELLKNKNIHVLYDRINDIKSPFFTCLIFGSYAQGKQTKQSDIDLCLITDDLKIKEQFEKIARLLPLEIHLLVFSVAEFVSMLKTSDPTVGKEIIANKIILKGIEAFYELINYAR